MLPVKKKDQIENMNTKTYLHTLETLRSSKSEARGDIHQFHRLKDEKMHDDKNKPKRELIIEKETSKLDENPVTKKKVNLFKR